jgi:23S rRNA (guanine745-N1)-methyltransferase
MGCFFVSNRKKELSKAEVVAQWQDVFRCPVCDEKMKMSESKSLICAKGHCFDLSKSGYLNFLSHHHQDNYTKHLFAARRRVFQSGFFDPLLFKISDWILDGDKRDSYKILDAGCGEGSCLSKIQAMLKENNADILGVGLDISKEGINLASKKFPGSIWCVADLSKTPFASNRFDFIVNILSPANYREFKRLLTKDGVIIKIVPGKNYLCELREIFYENTPRQVYKNNGTVKSFMDNMDVVESHEVEYEMILDKGLMTDLVSMTPLSWGITEDRIEKVLGLSTFKLTIDLKVLFGIRSNS